MQLLQCSEIVANNCTPELSELLVVAVDIVLDVDAEVSLL